ncbi:unnamed protein product [Rhodiola kirilowii]
MRIISWNCRGLGRPRTVRALKELISSNRPQILGLIETKLKDSRWDQLKLNLGYRCCFAVSSRGRAGGLALLWNEQQAVSLRSYSRYHIDVVVESEEQFRLTLFYGDPRAQNRGSSWDLIRRLASVCDLPWLVMGDFNEVCYSWEATGVRQREESRLRAFRDVLEECGLFDLGWNGNPYTFSNKRTGDREARVRLDRFVANGCWRRMFPLFSVRHSWANASDHCPIVLDLRGEKRKYRQDIFRFEIMWMRHDRYAEKFGEIWQEALKEGRAVSSMLESCGRQFKRWNDEEFGNVKRRIERLKKQIQELQRGSRCVATVEEENRLSAELDEWLAREECIWKQRARTEWLKEGDRNTAFFHARASHRRKINKLSGLENEQGELISEEKDMLKIVEGYFRRVFTSSNNEDKIDWQMALEAIPRRVTEEMNRRLSEPFTLDEVRRSLFQMSPTKAPGPDGFPAVFFQKHWEELSGVVGGEVLNFLNNGSLDESLNLTRIVLIPKVRSPVKMEELRPISLCNVVMKLITKCLANRFQEILPQVISEPQCAFVKGRVITDNVLIAHEISHYIRSRRKQKNGWLSVKLDISKAYDKLEWFFLERMMLRLGFNDGWVRKIMKCVKSVSYVVKMNDMVTDLITPERGLRQGDPLSPYLFILCSEWLSCNLEKWQDKSQIQGIKISPSAPRVSHLLFADDSILFCKAELRMVRKLRQVLNEYEEYSGQTVNYIKSEVCCSPNVQQELENEICDSLGIKAVEKHGKYLGLPMVVGQNKSECFRALEENVRNKIGDWKARLLSSAGKEILIKSVLTAMPQYAMTCYKLPLTLCRKLDADIINFWWAKKRGDRSIHWMDRKILTKEKSLGGLGLRCMEYVNDAFTLKQCWRMLSKPESLLSRVFKGRYWANTDFWNAEEGNRPSHVWRGICRAKHLLKEGLDYNQQEGLARWRFSSSGEFTVRSAYKLVKMYREEIEGSQGSSSDTRQVTKFWNKLWRLNLPNKAKLIGWRLFHNGLPDAQNLARRGCEVDIQCAICYMKGESAIHTLKDCWWSRVFWDKLGVDKKWLEIQCYQPADWLWFGALQGDSQMFRKLICGIWLLWFNRNRTRHGEKCWSTEELCNRTLAIIKRCDQLAVGNWEKWCWRGHVPSSIDRDKATLAFCDASWSDMEQASGLANIFRRGSCVSCVNVVVRRGIRSSLVAEGLAVLKSMNLAEELGLEEVIFLTDSKEVAWALFSGNGDPRFSQEWLPGCLELLNRHAFWSSAYIYRELNEEADALAKRARRELWEWNPVWRNVIV